MVESIAKAKRAGEDVGKTKFVHYFNLVLDALKDMGPSKPRDVFIWIEKNSQFPREDLGAKLATGKKSRFEKNIEFARFYLAKAGLVRSPEYGVWEITDEGRTANLDYKQSYKLFRDLADKFRTDRLEGQPENLENIDADNPENVLYREDVPPLPDSAIYWFVGASWKEGDQTARFLQQGIWQTGWTDESRYSDKIRQMRVGEKIAIKSTFTRKRDLPFNARGKSVSCMVIKATGTILENLDDGRTVKVAWDPSVEPRVWYLYTHWVTLVGVEPKNDTAKKLIAFTFKGERQDLNFWLSQPYWAKKYGEAISPLEDLFIGDEGDNEDEEVAEDTTAVAYTVSSIVEDGCFIAKDRIENVLARLEIRKNVILQGPPGTGKTWLAKRLAYALIGRNAAKADERMKVVQFHPSLSYEDFVRGWRPTGDGRLTLTDGLFLEAVNAAKSDLRPFVVVIEEINRGNPATIFGELLTLLESDKRRSVEGISLAYNHPDNRLEKVFLPDNLYVIGTMNVADRSLALVDLALRRRFSFFTLEPEYNDAWVEWCVKQGKLDVAFIEKVRERVSVLNRQIVSKLGEQFKVGHSYFTPGRGQTITNGKIWFQSIVETEIGPLLEEYFYEDTAKANDLRAQLLAGL